MNKSVELLKYYYAAGGSKLILAKIKDKTLHTYSAQIVLQEALKNKRIDEYEGLLKRLYRIFNGGELDLQNPKRYTEKIQWVKLYGHDALMTRLCDKLLVRDWVAEMIGDQYLIPLLGAWERFDQIDFDSLPERFVLKSNTGSGNNLIVKDKTSLDLRKTAEACKRWNEINFAYKFLELQYRDIKPVILAEQYMESGNGELQDYKFLCFDGKPAFCWVDVGRFSEHKRNVYDLNWNLQPWNQFTYGNTAEALPKPKNFEKMIEIAEKLAQGFPHVRVDLYNIEGTIYFGEMTFTNGSGFEPIIPKKYDGMLGEMWKLR